MARTVQIAAGKKSIQLPNGFAYDAGQQVVISDDQFKQIKASLFPSFVIDLGNASGDSLGITGAPSATAAAAAPATKTVPVNLAGVTYKVPLYA